MKTADLTGTALDWAVAQCADLPFPIVYDEQGEEVAVSPSTDWSQGGPIIERSGISLEYTNGDWIARPEGKSLPAFFDYSPLVAAMRCYVAGKMGDDVDVPPEFQQ